MPSVTALGQPLLHRYIVGGKLGWGNFSEVWKCWDRKRKRDVAVKVQKSDAGTTEQAHDEIKLLRSGQEGDASDPARALVVRLLDEFTLRGPQGSHVCLALELLGPSLYHCLPQIGGISLANVKLVMQRVLRGLEYLHDKARIIHTDVKPENVLLAKCGPCPDLTRFCPGLRVKLADLGNSCWREKHFSDGIGTQEYRAPEVILETGYDTQGCGRDQEKPQAPMRGQLGHCIVVISVANCSFV